jgi:hypothetical protein
MRGAGGSGDIIFHSLSCRGIIVYLENQSVCPIVGIGSPPSSESERVSPLGSKGGEQHSLASEGVGGPNSDDWEEAVALCILSGLGGRLKEKSPSRGRPEFGGLFLFLGYE